MVTDLVTDWLQAASVAKFGQKDPRFGSASRTPHKKAQQSRQRRCSRCRHGLGRAKLLILKEKAGVADGTRTHDNRNHNPGLYQLSYSHHSRKLACPTGIEPVTLSLEG
jgi:hypothetical protein